MALGFPYDPQYVHLMGTWWWTILKPLDWGRTYFATKPCICLWNFRWNLRLQCTIASYHPNILRPLFWRMIYATDVHVFLDRQCIVVLVRMWNMFSGGTKPVQLLLDLQKSMMLCFMVYFNAVHGCGIFQVWTHTHTFFHVYLWCTSWHFSLGVALFAAFFSTRATLLNH